MSIAAGIRRCHRWIANAFPLTVAANFAAMALGKGAPPSWITYSPLAPLALPAVTRLYLFALPYFSRDHVQSPAHSQSSPAS